MRRIGVFVLGATAATLISCSGLYRRPLLPGDASRTPDLRNLGPRRAVIVLRDPAVPTLLVFDSAGFDFTYRHVRPCVEQSLASMLRGHVAALDVAFESSPPGYDLYVVPEVRLAGGSVGLGTSCISTVTVTVLDESSRVLATRTETGKLEYLMQQKGFEGCPTLVTAGLTNAGSAALADADAALGPRGGGR